MQVGFRRKSDIDTEYDSLENGSILRLGQLRLQVFLEVVPNGLQPICLAAA